MANDLINFAKKLANSNLDVYFPEKRTSYFWFTDGVNIGYCQLDRMDGFCFSSVHKANLHTGTGFDCGKGIFNPTIVDAKKALCTMPQWASSLGFKAPNKYKNWNEFQSKYWQALVKFQD